MNPPVSRTKPVARPRSEFAVTARLALPIALGLAGHGFMTTLDAAFLGRHSTEALAGCGLGTNLHLPVLLIGYGMVTGVSVLSAQGRGAGDTCAGARTLRAGLVLAAVCGLGGALALQAAVSAGVNGLFAMSEGVKSQADAFLLALAWSTPFSVLFQALKNHAESHGRPWRALLWLVSGLGLNAALCGVLVFGAFGLPAMGAAGAGLATLAGRVLMLAGMAWQERDALRAAFSAEAKGGLRAMTAFGVPCALHLTAEVGVFALAPLMVGRWFGAESLGAHQIAVGVAGLAFMLPLGIAQAAGIRVGEAFGARDAERLRRIGDGARNFALAFMGVYAAFMVCAHNAIPALFTGAGGSPETNAIAARLLLVAAAFALADGVQVTLSGALRGLGDARFTSAMGLLGYWGVGLPAGVLLAFPAGWQVTGIWIGLAVGLCFAAAAFSWRWRVLTARYAKEFSA